LTTSIKGYHVMLSQLVYYGRKFTFSNLEDYTPSFFEQFPTTISSNEIL